MLEDIIVPIFVCFALPVGMVFFVMWARRNETNRKAEVALKAIENGVQINPDFFNGKTAKTPKSVKQKVFGNLKTGLILAGLGVACILPSLLADGFLKNFGFVSAALLFLGIAFIIYFFIAKKHFSKEIEAEEAQYGKAE